MEFSLWISNLLSVTFVLLLGNTEGEIARCGLDDCYVQYNTNTEICCSRTVYSLELDINGNRLTDCCQETTEMYSTATHDCCGTTGVIDKSTHGCCGPIWANMPFNLQTEGCCDDHVYDKASQVCCDNTLNDKQDHFTCCGGDYMDTRVGTCCNGKVVNGIGECCGDGVAQIYQPGNDLCCSSNGASVVFESSRNQKCCGMDKYDPQLELCCEMVINERPDNTTGCCGTTTFQENIEMCCEGQVVPRGSDTHCCGQIPYNADNEACCHREVVPYEGRADCCDDMPYNKEASTCVFETYYNQWYVDFSVPEIDGITRTWSRNLTAYLISEQFECGGSLHNYGEDGNACCGGVITYNTFRQLCCISRYDISVSNKTTENMECCGSFSYNPDVQGCCHGLLFHQTSQKCCTDGTVRDLNENCVGLHKCYDDETSTLDSTCEVMSNAFTPYVRHIPYDSNTAVCTTEGVRALPTGVGYCNEAFFYKSEKICCKNQLYNRFEDNQEVRCCDSFTSARPTYFPETESCLNGKVHPIPEDVAKTCGPRVYDIRTEGCDSNEQVRKKDDIDAKPDTCYSREHGKLYYNKMQQGCCDGRLITANHTCCKESDECCEPNKIQGYNYETSMCCDGFIRAREEGHECCGKEKYDTQDETKICCVDQLHSVGTDGTLYCDGQTVSGQVSETEIICRGNRYYGNDIKCCGGEQYEPSTELCCRDTKYRKTDDHQECCGSVPFSPEEGALCCEDSLYNDTAEGDSCCDKLKYNTLFQTCCTTGGKNYVMSADDQCCSNGEAVDTSRDTCCDGLIHKEIANGQCCGNQVIRDPVHEQCCGGHYYHISSGPKQCCNNKLIATFATCYDNV
ncbi:uncharacterized protein [Apostichopus japonicus]|uniref:uncharacterized protein isoform X2 n=1 Tax=Stichopus japonicus TaxID=307972 RepID=UPI003AB20ECC